MIKKLSGYLLAGIGLLGFIYFKNYRGDTIPLPILWLVLSSGVVVIGVYLIVSEKLKRQTHKDNEIKAKLSRIKENGEKIFIDFANCEFKTSTISESNQETFSRIQIIDALYDPNRNYTENNRDVTYIIYKHKNGNTFEKFVSPPFSIPDTMLKYYVSQNKIALYVERFDRTKYFFNVE